MNEFGAKHKNSKNEYKIKERVVGKVTVTPLLVTNLRHSLLFIVTSNK
jgi:hypothetical protein